MAFFRAAEDRLGLFRHVSGESVHLSSWFQKWQLGSESIEPFPVSVVIPVLNGGIVLQNLVHSLTLQRGVKVDIVLVDSGTIDGSLDGYGIDGSVEVIRLKAGAFEHSTARNCGVDMAQSESVLLTVQDAEIPDDFWLLRVCQMQAKLGTVALSVAEMPRSTDDAYAAFAVHSYNRSIFNGRMVTLVNREFQGTRLDKRQAAAIGNVACLYRRNILKQYRFEGLFGEDFSLGLRLLKAGLPLGKTSEVYILHSHNRPAFYWLKRNYCSRKLLIQHSLDDGLVLTSEKDIQSVVAGFLMFVGEIAGRTMSDSALHETDSPANLDYMARGSATIAVLDPRLSEFLCSLSVSRSGLTPRDSVFSGIEIDLLSHLRSEITPVDLSELPTPMLVKAASSRLGWVLGGFSPRVAEIESQTAKLLGSLVDGI